MSWYPWGDEAFETARRLGRPAPFLSVLRSTFVHNRVLAVVEEDRVAERVELVPLVRGRLAQGGKATAYVCEKQVCQRPTTDPKVFEEQLRAGAPPSP